MGRTFAIAAGILALSACAKAPLATAPLAERQMIEARLKEDIAILASDAFSGRRPGTEGETLTVDYLIAEMQAAGLVSGTNDPGSAWKAPVGLISGKPVEGSVSIAFEDNTRPLGAQDAAAYTSARQLVVDSTSMIFVGYEADTVDPEDDCGQGCGDAGGTRRQSGPPCAPV